MTEQCIIPIAIESYKDEITCDVLEMNAWHILLGRPWDFDTHANHEGRSNISKLQKDGKKISLGPLAPKMMRKLDKKGKKSLSTIILPYK